MKLILFYQASFFLLEDSILYLMLYFAEIRLIGVARVDPVLRDMQLLLRIDSY